MANYWVKTPQWLKKFFPSEMIWEVPEGDEPAVYLTFDDGPHPKVTQFVLDQLAASGARATFFCVGNNVSLYPDVYRQIVDAGHITGNHTFNHLNGWKTNNFTYLKNIEMAARVISNKIFRPPYGRIKLTQVRKLLRGKHQWKVYMWDILSGDFDPDITAKECADNVISNLKPGSIVVFHDSEKAWNRLQYALPEVLRHCREHGLKLKSLPK